jgi:hypothetical protein
MTTLPHWPPLRMRRRLLLCDRAFAAGRRGGRQQMTGGECSFVQQPVRGRQSRVRALGQAHVNRPVELDDGRERYPARTFGISGFGNPYLSTY